MSRDAPSFSPIDGTRYRFAIVAASYNPALVEALVQQAVACLEASGAAAPTIERVPGSAELPFAASLLAASRRFDAILAIGVVIAGDTNHHNLIGHSTALALQDLSLRTGIPIINGILVVENQAQAEARASGQINRGKEFAEAALSMAQLNQKWKTTNNQP